MRVATRACVALLMIAFGVSTAYFQKLRSADDPRNQSPAVGTGGSEGGPTGLFTIYDGQTLRRGEFTFSIAYSNYDRDPGNVDITEVPISFNFGLSNHLELFFKTTGWRGVKVNNPRNLSGFYLPNSQLNLGQGLRQPPAIILAPNGPNVGTLAGSTVFRPAGAPFVQFPFFGGTSFNFGLPIGFSATLGTPTGGGGNWGPAGTFPGIGSPVGSILPGIVLATTTLPATALTRATVVPTTYTIEPAYLPDAPFINRIYGTSSFNNLVFGAKWRLTSVDNPVGIAIIPFYRWWMDKADDLGGFNMMQRGAGPGGNFGDIGVTVAADARLSKRINVSANIGYVLNSNPKFGNVNLLDRPDELTAGVAVDFPVNKHFQPILELNSTNYVGGHTPNALPQNPIDGLAGFKAYPSRWWGIGMWYRVNFNPHSASHFDQKDFNLAVNQITNVNVTNRGLVVVPGTTVIGARGVPVGFDFSSDPNGFGAQLFFGRRNVRQGPVFNKPPDVASVTLSNTTVNLPCPAGTHSTGGCSDNHTISVSTSATDPENDVLTYNYTVSGGRIVGQGANVSWDLSGVNAGTYTITTAVDDGCGVCGKTNTQTITVAQCKDCAPNEVPCTCPTLTTTGPTDVVRPGTPMTFTATSSGDVTYNWTVSSGTISSGQGTSSITVDTAGLAPNTNVTATVTIAGTNICATCPTNSSATGSVAAPPTANLVDTYGKLSNDDVKARIDPFYTTLNNDPTSHGYIIIYGTPAQIRAARAQIMKAIAFRKYDPSRVTIVEGPPQGAEVQVKLYQVPAGAENPVP